MAYANGRIPKSQLAALPLAFSNKREQEYLTSEAYASLVRMMLRAVADTGSTFSVWDAYRSFDEQVAMLKKNYYPSGGGNRTYGGQKWAKKSGRPATASPGYSNHGNGVAVDIHPGPIQAWLKNNAARFGWVNDVPSEPWHWSYLNPGRDQYRGEGLPNVKGMQAKLGIEQDGKPGPDFVKAVKAFQQANGLTVDGIAGPATAKAILGKGDAAPAPVIPVGPVGGASVPAPQPAGLVIEEAGPAKNAYADRKGHSIKHATIHWWGRPSGQTFEGIRDYLIDNPREVSAHYVVSGTRIARILPEDRGAWGNGNRTANLEGIVIECDPNKVTETLPTLALLLADIFKRNGVLPVYPHDHWTPTECPGDYRAHIPALVEAATGGAPITVTTPAPVSPSGVGLPTGKELLVKLADVPDFPLLRTPGNLCYYGGDSKQTAVSGKMPNSLVPGEIFGSGKSSGAHGLKAWQKQMNARGYSLAEDGRYGDDTESAAKNLQRLAGFATDGKIGPSTFYAAWLLPAVD